MADVKLSAETNHVTSFDGNERIRVCDDPAGTPATGYTEIRDLFASDGWLSSNATWAYASASSITISGDVTAFIKKGTKLKFTQGTVKYFVVLASSYSVPNTTLTLAVNTDYPVINGAISAKYSSNYDNPAGFPQRFNFSPTWNNLSVGNGVLTSAVYSLSRERCSGFIQLVFGSTTSISGGVFITVPITISVAHTNMPVGGAYFSDTGTAFYTGQSIAQSTAIAPFCISSSGTYSTFLYMTSTIPFTWATGDILSFSFDYPW